MGIQGLTRFMNERFLGWQPANLHDVQSHRLIVDGNNVCYQLYKRISTWSFGGEYYTFSNKVESFFESLRGDVIPIVVFDGASHDDKKMDTVCDRRIQSMEEMKKMQSAGLAEEDLVAKENSSVLPVFLIPVFMDVLRRLGIEFHVVDIEADVVIAALANHYKCPVLASDSDYFIFKLEYGFIHLDRYWKNKRQSLFNIVEFMRLFSLQEHDLCLVLPIVFGNDFIKASAQRKSPDVYKLRLDKLAGYKSCEEYIVKEGNEVIRKNFETAKKFYTNLKLPPGFFDENAVIMIKDPCISSPMPDWVFGKFKRGIFPSYLLTIYHSKVYLLPRVVEVIKMSEAWKMSRYIRQFLYGLIGMSTSDQIEEITRKKFSAKIETKLVTPKLLKPPVSINDLIFLHNVTDELSYLVLSILKCRKISEDDIERIFNVLPDEWKLPIAATFYWYRHLDIPVAQRRDLVKSLLLIFLKCFPYPHISLDPVSIDPEHLTALHAFGQWQCVYSDAMALNYVAREPFSATSPASLYSGEAVMCLATKKSVREEAIRILVADPEKWELFNIFLYLITGLDENGRRGKHVLVEREDTTVADPNTWTVV